MSEAEFVIGDRVYYGFHGIGNKPSPDECGEITSIINIADCRPRYTVKWDEEHNDDRRLYAEHKLYRIPAGGEAEDW